MTPISPTETFKFLRALARNNDREWFHAHKARLRDASARARSCTCSPTCSRPARAISEHYRADPQARRRLAVPHPSRHALRQRQDAVQDLGGRAPLPRAAASRSRRPRSTCTCSRATASSAPGSGIRNRTTQRRIRAFHRSTIRQLEGGRARARVPRALRTATARRWCAPPRGFPPTTS